MFGSSGETYELAHNTIDRTAYMPGVLLVVKKIRSFNVIEGKLNGTYEEFFANGDLVVIKTSSGTDTTLSYNASPSSATQYSVSGAGASGGGSITLGGGATAGDKYTIYRDLAIARSTDFSDSGWLP